MKLGKIREIRASGHEVEVEIVRYGLPDEKTAHLIEAVAIDALTIGHPADLTNRVAGHGGRWSTLEELRPLAAAPAKIRIEDRPCILIRPRQQY